MVGKDFGASIGGYKGIVGQFEIRWWWAARILSSRSRDSFHRLVCNRRDYKLRHTYKHCFKGQIEVRISATAQ